jgi:4-diphosphocytidyl-2C-methyl-D-erythritol kinase
LAYKMIDDAGICRKSIQNRKKLNLLINGFINNDYKQIVENVYNKFEDVVFQANPVLKEIKNKIFESNADAGFMSGSGSTMVGIYNSKEKLNIGLNLLKNQGYNCIQIDI